MFPNGRIASPGFSPSCAPPSGKNLTCWIFCPAMGQQAGTSGTWPAPSKPISQGFKLWDSTRIQMIPPTGSSRQGQNQNLTFSATSMKPLPIKASSLAFSRYGTAVRIFNKLQVATRCSLESVLADFANRFRLGCEFHGPTIVKGKCFPQPFGFGLAMMQRQFSHDVT